MKIFLALLSFCILAVSCNNESTDKTTETEKTEVTKPDLAQLKKEIQERETAWSNADNALDVNAIASFYSEDAISLPDDKPMYSGNSAIKKGIEESLAKRMKGAKVNYEVVEAFGNENLVTEVGKSSMTDSTGKVFHTGKYMVIWEKRDGKWIAIRDIYNDDAKGE